ncbi:hypothetical protein LOD99_6922 [Oopsacas minuta]|uniref:Uncharacterized protein n=1 Tax=Oopsacas minuta TaxID=111878 RepID=A0AAV7JKK5_9METZ|nr:hypothetical protein LOD99_6922 [Oopsacas minuta]
MNSDIRLQPTINYSDKEVYKEAKGRLTELEARIQLLEDENIAQRHMIQLGELRKQKENDDMKKYHTRLINELEKEKKKLEDEIFQVQ